MATKSKFESMSLEELNAYIDEGSSKVDALKEDLRQATAARSAIEAASRAGSLLDGMNPHEVAAMKAAIAASEASAEEEPKAAE